jgi:hypothetical protein
LGKCKKKLDTELEIHFPQYFGADVDYIDKLREFELLKLQQYLGEEVNLRLMAINEYFLKLNAPKVFNPFNESCILIENDRQFEDICNSIFDDLKTDIKAKSVYEFYSTISYLEKKAEKLKEAIK